ncbi:Hypothetical predicted protein [Paramuricea clavata]|uniref:Uncharacterized protein n=1 Tax=Paramuricea clavata TaxID=317549 RepID=A0A6S7HGW9_PARCT|nr:Hypothetical predicted protein [Paramuricea clavata]
MFFFSLQTRICPAPSFLTSFRASKVLFISIENYGYVWRFNKNIDYFSASHSLINVSLDRFNRDILQTETFHITELLAEVNQQLLGHVHANAGVRKACAELNNYILRLLPCVDLGLVGLSDSIRMNIDAAFAFSNDLSVYATSVCPVMYASNKINCGIGYFTEGHRYSRGRPWIYISFNRRETEILDEHSNKDINKLTECNFKGDIQHYYESFHPETRIWLLEKVDRWFERKDSNSQVMILTADAGFGKTTFAAKVCKEYQKTRQLKACHFFNSRYTDRRDPCKMFESLGSQLCKNVNGFKEILDVQLQRNHSRSTIGDAFRVFLKDPLDSLPDEMPNFLIVIDGLDESLSREKEHLLDVIEEEFRKLPKCVKVFITSRPELVTKEKLERLNPVEILRDDEGNKEDLKNYLVSCVSGRYTVDQYDMEEMVKMCEGSFLYAHYYQLELRKLNIVENVLSVVPKGTHSIYQKYFKRLEEELKTVSIDIEFDKILEILVAMQNPFPLSLIANILKLPGSTRTMRAVITKVNECLSALLPVYDDCVTVFHKTVVDWLRADGKYGNHSFSVSLRGAHKTLWQTCRQIFEQLKGAEEVEKQAKKYALENGVDHLWDTTFLLTKNCKYQSIFGLF